MLRDLRLTLRALARRPGFAATAILTLGLGIGASTTIFSVVQGILLEPLPHSEGQRLLTIWGERTEQGFSNVPITAATFRDIEEQATLLEGVSGGWFDSGNLTGGQEPVRVRLAWVTPNHMRVLRISPILGRGFEDTDNGVVLLSYGLWQRRFSADSTIIGQTIQLNGAAQEVIGVLPETPDPNLPGVDGVTTEAELWRPMPVRWLQGDDRSNGWLRIAARLAPGASVASARAELDAVAARIRDRVPETAAFGFQLRATPLLDEIVGRVRPMLLVLLGAVILVLLIACANVANLLLVRAQGREHELTIRAALGGGQRHIIRQVMGESLILSLAGGALGVSLALAGVKLLVALDPANVPRLETVSIDRWVLGFALAASLSASLLAGVWPAFKAARLSGTDALRTRRGTASPGKQRVGGGLVMVQVALSLILLAGAGLLLKSFAALSEVRPGYRTEGIITLAVAPSSRFDTGERVANFFRELESGIAALPGVQAVGSTLRLPLAGGLFTGPYATEGQLAEGAPESEADYRPITPGYFEAMGTGVISGRGLSEFDGPDVVVVDQLMAQRSWPDGDAVGQRIRSRRFGGDPEWATVVGVVEHMRHEQVAEDGRETIFWAVGTWARRGLQLYVAARTSGDPAALVAPIREVVRSIDPNTPIAKVRTMETLAADAMATVRFAMILITIFAATAVALAAIGLYGVLAYLVSRRTNEIGVRLALGATRGSVFGLVVRRGVALALGGLALGLVGAAGLTRVLGSLLFEVRSTDPSTYGVVGMVLILVAVLASALPAMRAMRVAPVRALRED